MGGQTKARVWWKGQQHGLDVEVGTREENGDKRKGRKERKRNEKKKMGGKEEKKKKFKIGLGLGFKIGPSCMIQHRRFWAHR